MKNLYAFTEIEYVSQPGYVSLNVNEAGEMRLSVRTSGFGGHTGAFTLTPEIAQGLAQALSLPTTQSGLCHACENKKLREVLSAPRPDVSLGELVAKWRAAGEAADNKSYGGYPEMTAACMAESNTYERCADELESALRAQSPAEGGKSEKLYYFMVVEGDGEIAYADFSPPETIAEGDHLEVYERIPVSEIEIALKRMARRPAAPTASALRGKEGG